jgi:hypothetical protein
MELDDIITLAVSMGAMFAGLITTLVLWPPGRRQPEHLAELLFGMTVSMLGPVCLVEGLAMTVFQPGIKGPAIAAMGGLLIAVAVNAIRRARGGSV